VPMLAARRERERLVVVTKPRPRMRPGWAVVRVRLAGICNTDLEILRGYHNFRGTPGHEFVGEVVACGGTGAARLRAERRWAGRRVAGEINITCHGLGLHPLCEYCRRGIPTHCARRRVLGIIHHDGAFAEYLTLPLVNLHAVPNGVPDECAVFTEPLAAACQILEQAPAIARGARVAVLGDGKLGQLIVRVLAAAGARVTLYGRHRKKLALAAGRGATTALLARGRRASATARTHPRFPFMVEATGSPEGLETAIRMTEPRGTLVLKSTFHGAAHLETWPIVVDEQTVIGSRCGPFPRAMELLRSGRVDPRPLISRVFPLREAPAAIREAQRPGVLKVLLDPRQ
jgi:threonine dehydrogenase-like Zn-dependent dehydrogenase